MSNYSDKNTNNSHNYQNQHTNNTILNSILARLVEYDIFLKKIREAYFKNSKMLLEIDQNRKTEIEDETVKRLEEIEKIVYHKFQILIGELKLQQDKYSKENVKLINELDLLKKDKIDMIKYLKDCSFKIKSLRNKIGDGDLELTTFI